MKIFALPGLLVLLLIQDASAHVVANDAALSKVEVDKCTSIVVGPAAGTTGAMATHLADCSDCDFRINKVPAKDWPAGSMRPLYQYKGNYPATLTSRRGETWHPSNLEGTPDQLAAWGAESIITGYIPQVNIQMNIKWKMLLSDEKYSYTT